MTQAIDTQPDQPLLPSEHPDLEPLETEYGSTVHLDVIDLAAPDDDY